MAKRHRRRESAFDRFERNVRRDDDGCWRWTGPHDFYGYARMRFHRDGESCRGPAHRWIYEYCNGLVHPGLDVHHLCGIRDCVNPAHLKPLERWEHNLITSRDRWTKWEHERGRQAARLTRNPKEAFYLIDQ